MSQWRAIYKEGFVNDEGERVTVTEEVLDAGPWAAECDALSLRARWAESLGASVRFLSDGVEQTDDVAERPEFRALRVVQIWRRVSVAQTGTRRTSDTAVTPEAG